MSILLQTAHLVVLTLKVTEQSGNECIPFWDHKIMRISFTEISQGKQLSGMLHPLRSHMFSLTVFIKGIRYKNTHMHQFFKCINN